MPEVLVQEVLALLAEYGYSTIEEVETAKEDILFSLPKELRSALKNDENVPPARYAALSPLAKTFSL